MKSEVGAPSLFALGVNGIVGVGIFFTPSAIGALVPGSGGALVYLATAGLLLPVALTLSVLGRALPLDGGPYVWARSAFGERTALAVGWVAAVSALLSLAAVIAGLRDHLAPSLGFADESSRAGFAAVLTLALALVAGLGLRPSAWTWDVLTLLKLVPLVLLVAALARSSAPPPSPALPAPSGAFGRALLVAVFPLQGFEIVPVLAGSARRARLSVPIATLGSLVFAAALYAAIQLVCVRTLPDLATQEAPLVAAAGVVGGNELARLVAFGTNLSALGIAFGMMVMTPRYLAALGTDAGFGGWLGQSDGNGVSRAALGLSAALVCVLVAFEALGSLFALSSAAVLLQYLAAELSLVRLAWKREHGLGPAFALPAVFGLGAVGLLAFNVESRELPVLGAALGLGLGLFAWQRRARRSR